MSENITFKPATDIRRDDIVDTFNAGYSDYFVPIQFTGATFNAFIIRESINLGASVIALLDDQPVALGLMGVREPHGWIGTVAVRPEFRRKGIARQIMHQLMSRSRELGLSRIQLEVITKNEGAYALYKDLGFSTERRLLILSRPPEHETPAIPDNSLIVNREEGVRVLPMLASLQDMPRNWQRQAESLEPSIDLSEALVAQETEDGPPVGVILFGIQPGQVRLSDLAMQSRKVGDILIAELINRHPAAHMSFVNVGEDEAAAPVLHDAGFTESLSQYEMYLSL